MVPTLLVAVFLLIPGLEQRIGRTYLPIALAVSIIALSLEFGSTYSDPGVHVLVTLPTGWQFNQFWTPTESILLTLVPCVLAGAVYGVRGGARAASLATLVHLGLGIAIWCLETPLYGFFLLLPLRIAVLFAFPLITGYLADTWRQEHNAVQEANQQLRGYAATIEQLAISRERVRLARDLHDTLAHTLAALVVQLEAVDALQEAASPAAGAQLERVKVKTRAGLDEARRAILDLRSSPVEELGLVGALEGLVEQFAQRSGIVTRCDLRGEPTPLAAVVQNTLYRIVQEALDNVERHAKADQAVVSLSYPAGGGVELRVQDDGRGFDPDSVGKDRVGLLGIRERADLVGARVRVESAAQEGAMLIVEVPGE